jgi:hypothetical protein
MRPLPARTPQPGTEQERSSRVWRRWRSRGNPRRPPLSIETRLGRPASQLAEIRQLKSALLSHLAMVPNSVAV